MMFFSPSSSTNNVFYFPFCFIPSDPSRAVEEVAFGGRWAEGGARDGGGSEQASGGGRWAGGRLQEPGGGDWRAGRQFAIAGRGKKFM